MTNFQLLGELVAVAEVLDETDERISLSTVTLVDLDILMQIGSRGVGGRFKMLPIELDGVCYVVDILEDCLNLWMSVALIRKAC